MTIRMQGYFLLYSSHAFSLAVGQSTRCSFLICFALVIIFLNKPEPLPDEDLDFTFRLLRGLRDLRDFDFDLLLLRAMLLIELLKTQKLSYLVTFKLYHISESNCAGKPHYICVSKCTICLITKDSHISCCRDENGAHNVGSSICLNQNRELNIVAWYSPTNKCWSEEI
jgi:hypothetical protein